MICPKDFFFFFLKNFILVVHKFSKLVLRGGWKFSHVREIANFVIEEFFYWVVGIWPGVLLSILTFSKAKNNIL